MYIYIYIYECVSDWFALFYSQKHPWPRWSTFTPATAATARGIPAAPKNSGPDPVGAGLVVPTMSMKVVFDFPCNRFVTFSKAYLFLSKKFDVFFPHIYHVFFLPRTGDFSGVMKIDKIRNASSAAVSQASPVRAVSPLSDIGIDLGNVCFIVVKRYISERLLCCGVFG